MRTKFLKALTLLSVPLLFAGCGIIPHRVKVPQLITPLSMATLDELVARLNDLQKMHTLTARVSLQFQAEEPEFGRAKRYTGEGWLILARPAHVHLLIQAPLVKTNIAEMASDGQRFQVLVFPEDYRMFLQGSNDRDYTSDDRSLEADPTLREARAFRRVRPQHFTEAFLIPPIDATDGRLLPVLNEERRIEEEKLPGQKRRMVVRTYYVVSLIELESQRGAKLRKKIWFDRTRGLLPVREEIFGDGGEMRSEVTYNDFAVDGTSNQLIPIQVQISRPYDRYSVRLDLSRESIVVNGGVSAQAFKLEKPEDWGDSVKIIDLDKKRDQ